jgi:hypothetical protein
MPVKVFQLSKHSSPIVISMLFFKCCKEKIYQQKMLRNLREMLTGCNGFQNKDYETVKEKTTSVACRKCFGCCFILLYERNSHTT